MKLSEAISLFLENHLTSKRPSHRDHCLGRLGDVRPDRVVRDNSLLSFLGDVSVETITVADLQRWANNLTRQEGRYQTGASSRPAEEGGLSASTIDGYRRVLSSFWKWAVRWPGIPVTADLTTAVSWPSTPKLNELPPKAISNEVAERLLRAPASMRDHVVIRFMLFTGARVHEVAALKLSNLHLQERYALLETTKGGKHRHVVFDEFTAALLAEYIDEYRPVTAVEQVFVTTTGEPKPITSDTIRLAMRRMVKRAGIKEPVSPHRLRHWFATTSLAHGGNLAAVQDLMGHSNPSMTRRYSKFAPELLRQQYDEVFGGASAKAISSGLFAAPVLLNNRRKGDEDYSRLAKRIGVEWLGPLPGNVSETTRWRCREGHEWETSYRSIQQGSGCHICANVARKKAGDFLELAARRGLFWLGPDVGNNSTAVTWKCAECGYEWQASFASVEQGSGCQSCAGNLPKTEADYHALGGQLGLTWLDTELPANVRTATRWLNGDGRPFEATFDMVRFRKQPHIKTDGRKSAIDYRFVAEKKGGQWVGGDLPQNYDANTLWLCALCGEEFEATYRRVDRGTCLCRTCALTQSSRCKKEASAVVMTAEAGRDYVQKKNRAGLSQSGSE